MLSPRLTQKGIGVLGSVDGKPLLTLSKESHLSFSRTALPIEERGAIFSFVVLAYCRGRWYNAFMEIRPVKKSNRILPAAIMVAGGAVMAACEQPQPSPGAPLPPPTLPQGVTGAVVVPDAAPQQKTP